LEFEINDVKIYMELKKSYALNKEYKDKGFEGVGYSTIDKYGLNNKLSFNSGAL